MDTHRLALDLMALQGCLGAFDTIYHHELTEALPRRPTARLELAIHAIRASIYSILFIGLSSWDWNGAWSVVLVSAFTIEIVLTLWDFVVEDRTRLLPGSERVTHTVLAINGGAFVALLILNCTQWIHNQTQLAWHPQGYLGAFLTLCGIGVGLSAIRDCVAALSLRPAASLDSQSILFGLPHRRFFITGATGFIGSRLVRRLLADGHEVDILTRNPRRAAWLFDGQVRCFTAMNDVPPDRTIDTIVNLAGARILGLPWTAKRRGQLLDSRVGTTERLVEWIGKSLHKPKLLISASAIGYYGIQARGSDTPLDETAATQPIFMSELCQRWEDAAVRAAANGVPVSIVRFGMVLGQSGALPMMLLPVRLGLGGRLGSGSQCISWVHIDDVIRAIATICRLHQNADRSVKQVYNVTSPHPVSQQEFSATAARLLWRPSILPTPAWPLRMILGEQSGLLLEGQRVLPKNLTDIGFVFSHPRLETALADLCG